MGEWSYEVKHGPDDQDDYSWVYASGVMVCVCKTKDAIEIVNACNRPDPAATMKEVVEVLEFYANPEIYKPHPHGLAFERRDKSDMARSILARLGMGS